MRRAINRAWRDYAAGGFALDRLKITVRILVPCFPFGNHLIPGLVLFSPGIEGTNDLLLPYDNGAHSPEIDVIRVEINEGKLVCPETIQPF